MQLSSTNNSGFIFNAWQRMYNYIFQEKPKDCIVHLKNIFYPEEKNKNLLSL